MTVNDIMHKALMAGLGVPEKMKEVIDELVEKGELSESQGAMLVKDCSDKASKTGEDISRNISDFIGKSLEKMNVPSKDEFEKLNRKVMSLSSRIKKIEESLKTTDS
jgi:polyhydroxyalkanoate synthesis regulator phasin